ncbi:MAG: hypothetical protein HN509_17525 [Halobacteriovoraceae bacterium]|jgi:hypothetical protein|nr:hypothetical protein [Halobacteriovoraceae bacterium]
METQKPIYECRYEPKAFFQYLWMLWGVSGFIFLFLDPGNGPLEIFFLGLYAVIIITSIMSFFNRENGFNHRIQFYSDHMVVPKAMMLFYWKEQVIFYREVDKISFGPIFHPKYGVPMEVNLQLGDHFYRIFGSKLSLEGMQGTLMTLKQKVGFEEREFSTATSAASQEANHFDPPSQNTDEVEAQPIVPEEALLWRGRIRWIVVACFICWTMAFFVSTRGGFHNLVDPSQLFVLGFALSTLIASALLYYIPWKKAQIHAVQKFFFLGFVFIYGGLGFFQTLISANGYFDSSTPEMAERKIENLVPGIQKNGTSCFHLESDPSERLPASESNLPVRKIQICNPATKNSEGPTFKVGDKVRVQINRGLFGVEWVNKVQNISK